MGPGEPKDDATGRELADQYDEEYFATHCSRGTAPPYRKGETHWEQFYDQVAEHIVRSLGPETAFDAGCAVGFLVEALHDRGVETHGRDISAFAIGEVRPDVRANCSVGSITDPIEGDHDLVLCIEVLEHLPADDAVIAVKRLASAGEQILFSSTPTDVDEPTHVNVRPPIYWIRQFASHGFAPVLTHDATYLCPHALLFAKSDRPVEEEVLLAAAELVRLRMSLAEQTRRAVDLNIRLAEALRTAHEITVRLAEADVDREEMVIELRSLERELSDDRRRSAESVTDLQSALARLHGVTHQNLLVDARLASIESSAFWRMTMPARRIADRIPRPVRSSVKRMLKSAKTGVRPDTVPALVVVDVLAPPNAPAPTDADVAAPLPTPATAASGLNVLLADQQFPQLQPLRVFRSPDQRPTVHVVTDSISAGSLFGGVATALILAAQVAGRTGGRMRVVTRTVPGDPAVVDRLLRHAGVGGDVEVETIHAGIDNATAIPTGDDDIFIPTSWWTAVPTVTAVGHSRVVYLLQEDERLFYPTGDESLRCAELMADDRLRTVVNSDMLFRHLTEGPSPLTGLGERSVVFEPAFPPGLYYEDRSGRAAGAKRTFVFYARPNNLRNLYWRGFEAIERSLLLGTLAADEWRFVFLGKDIGTVDLPGSPEVEIAENLSLEEYAAYVRSADLGLGLIYSPHPSYPPLDLAASGAVVVTNSYGSTKRDLSGYSPNIICTEPTVDALVDGIARGVALASDPDRHSSDGPLLARSWTETLAPVVDRILAWRAGNS
ncbi:MAG TPA: methyltransferase domain-containing protein [Acidimicrobiales bacterium]